MNDRQPPTIEAYRLPPGGLSLDGYRRLAYGLTCPGCHKRLHSKVVARLDAHGLPVAGRESRYRLTVLCNRSPCRMRISLEKLMLFILAPVEAAARRPAAKVS